MIRNSVNEKILINQLFKACAFTPKLLSKNGYAGGETDRVSVSNVDDGVTDNVHDEEGR